MKKRFHALRILSVFYIVLGWVMVGGSVLTGLFFLVGTNYLFYDAGYYFMPAPENGRSIGLVVLIVGLLIGLAIVAVGETLRISVEIENNTRATNQALERLLSLTGPGSGSTQPPSDPASCGEKGDNQPSTQE